MKRIKIFLLALLVILPLGVKAETKEPVKVYMFEAGGCPYCEQEKEYLQGLESYNEKFVIVEKETFIDHVDFAPGADYDLAQQVAKAFKKAGFKDADAGGTPFVIISDLYAATMYNPDLEKYINQAYEEGDKDIVTCISEGRDDCLPKKAGLTISPKALAIIGVSVVFVIGAVVFLNSQLNKTIVEDAKANEKHDAEKTKEEPKEKVEEKKSSSTKKKTSATNKKTSNTKSKK